MRIGIDVRLLKVRRGIGNYVHELLYGIAHAGSDHEYILYADSRQVTAEIPAALRSSLVVVEPDFYPYWEQLALPARVCRDRIDLLHCTANTAPIYLSKSIGLVVTIHDIMFLLPERLVPRPTSPFQKLQRVYYRRLVPPSARRADMIITDSNASRSDIVDRLPGVNPAHVKCVYLAPGRAFQRILESDVRCRLRNEISQHGPIVLGLGAADPRKNTAGLLEAFAIFISRIKGSATLLLVGLDSRAQKAVALRAERLAIGDRIIQYGFLPESRLVELYNLADMFVYPTMYEGFGFPVLEAMACGTPVIASAVSAIPEIAADAAIMVDPRDGEEIASKMQRVAEDATLRDDMRARGLLRVAELSWHKAASETITVYEDALQERS